MTDYIKMFKEADELFSKNIYDFSRYAIYKEIIGNEYARELTDQEVLFIVEKSLEFYDDTEYATPTGVACAINYYLIGELEFDPEYDIMAMTKSDFSSAWNSSDWK